MTSPIQLNWSIKQSFVDYVRSHGTVEVAAPGRELDGQFCFPCAKSSPEILRFVGSLGFDAHAGFLSATVANPWLHIGPETSYITIDGSDPTRRQGPRLRLADLPDMRPNHTFSGPHRTILAETGAVLFDFRYPSGEPLAPIHIT
ncbi:HtaA domain-containing protein [Rhodococcus opacus]|uniref:HtaA domain-containing protein n=1 Tax=Rhodococcus opacus TaxID=37919 RepID=UPI00155AEDAC|nr:HtaA domain-containing protein [Rhodococcus opacus]